MRCTPVGVTAHLDAFNLSDRSADARVRELTEEAVRTGEVCGAGRGQVGSSPVEVTTWAICRSLRLRSCEVLLSRSKASSAVNR